VRPFLPYCRCCCGSDLVQGLLPADALEFAHNAFFVRSAHGVLYTIRMVNDVEARHAASAHGAFVEGVAASLVMDDSAVLHISCSAVQLAAGVAVSAHDGADLVGSVGESVADGVHDVARCVGRIAGLGKRLLLGGASYQQGRRQHCCSTGDTRPFQKIAALDALMLHMNLLSANLAARRCGKGLDRCRTLGNSARVPARLVPSLNPLALRKTIAPLLSEVYIVIVY